MPFDKARGGAAEKSATMSKSKKQDKMPWNPLPLAVLKVEGISRGAAHVLTVLAARSNWKGETCVGHRGLVKDCKSSKQYVTDALKELYQKKLVSESPRNRQKRQADWKTINPIVLTSRTTQNPTQQDDAKSYPVGHQNPTQQDFNNPSQQGRTLQTNQNPNLADKNLADDVGLLVGSDDSLRSSSSNVAAATPAIPKTKIPPIPDTDELTWEEHHAIVKFEDETFRLLGLTQSEERHYPDMKRIAAVLVYRKRNHRWLLELVRWMKEHKAFWAKRLHAGDRAVGQLANFLETGECATQFDAYLALKDPDVLEAGLYDLTVEAVIHNSEPVTVGRGFDLEEAE
jgi:hypothetical protein